MTDRARASWVSRGAPMVRLRRSITETPLAKHHDKALVDGYKRKIAPIPWEEFERGKYPLEALDLAAKANRALASGELGAVTMFSRITASLVRHGYPYDLVNASTRAASDELRHSDYAARFATLCAGRELTLTIKEEALESAVLEPLKLDMLMLEGTTIGETLAAALLESCLRQASDPVAKVFFGNLVRDEVHHARFGWYYFAWRAPQWTRAERQEMANWAGELLVELEPRFSRGRRASTPSARKGARALGVLDTKAQLEAVRAVAEDQIVPTLDAMGLGGSVAWAARKRVSA